MSQPVDIAVRQAVKCYGSHRVLDGVDLAVAGGETVALIGPSGGGKSTLLRAINGLVTLDSGEVAVGPHVLRPGRRKAAGPVAQVRRMMGMIFQDFQLFPHRTALENVTEAPRRVLGMKAADARRRGMELLDRVGLADRHAAYPAELSGGQKQRVAIARAMGMSPRGLLCDEITSALDPELKGEVLAVLEDLKRDGLTLVLVTHEMAFARRAADRIVFLAGGRILEEGPARELLDSPRQPRTERFLCQLLDGAAAAAQPASVSRDAGGTRLGPAASLE